MSDGESQLQVAGHQARQRCLLHPSNRAGRNNNASSNAKIAPTVRPRIRNGKATSQTRGKRTTASKATGQHSTKRMHHSTKSSRTFIFLSFKFGADDSTPVDYNEPFPAGDVKWEVRTKRNGHRPTQIDTDELKRHWIGSRSRFFLHHAFICVNLWLISRAGFQPAG
jgi:hypothetical protein